MSVLDALAISLTGVIVVLIELGLLAFIVISLSKVVGKIGNLKMTIDYGKKFIEEKNRPKKNITAQTQNKNSVSNEDEITAVMVSVCEESAIPLEEIIFKNITEIK